ncbi:MAG: pilus assembly protein PilY [Proteobacteria bacterium]|nr:pilus assembly protein PilY [Pseudomonadota bacterium]
MPTLRTLLRRPSRRTGVALLGAVALVGAGSAMLLSAIAASPILAISQVPLAMTTPSRPRVLIAVANSQSMDAGLSGALMTGAGSLSGDLATLNASTSPLRYAVPAGFVPPLQAADASGTAPYTVTAGTALADNGPSRLNIAKAGIQAVLQTYAQNTDFALAAYGITAPTVYTTWTYYMSPPGGGFAFTSTPDPQQRYVANPCRGYTTASTTVLANCTAIANAGLYDPSTLAASAYMQIGAASDDPSINDVLYGRSLPAVFVDYGVPSPPTPYPPSSTYQLADYNANGVVISYPSSVPDSNRMVRSTNAGYVPYAPQIMYVERGYGYAGTQSATGASVLVPMTALGASPSASAVTTATAAFTPFLQPETNDATTTEIKAAALQSPVAGLLTSAQSYLAGLSAPADGACPQPQVVVLVSDGLPTQDLAGKIWPPLGSAAAQGYGVTASFNGDGSLASTNDQALADTITALQALKTAGIQTYVVGIGAGVDATANPGAVAALRAMAMAGGTGSYYPVSSSTALVDALNTVLVSAQNGTQTTTAAAVSATRLQAGSVAYQASYTASDTPYQDWTGDVVARNLDPTTGQPTGAALWSARDQLDAQARQATRLIATWNPDVPGGARGVPFEWAAGGPAGAISAAQQAALQPADTQGSSRLAYLRGAASGELRNGGAFRNRSHVLGDIVDSQPLYVGTPQGPSFDPSYFAFQAAQASRPAMLYVGANDGMLHAFDAASGDERFAFVPNGVFANLANLTALTYNQHHQFFVDGPPQSGDVQFADGSWHTLVVGGAGGGARSIYALDVTAPQNLTTESALASAVLWEYADADMGLSYSVPQLAPVAAPPGYAVFFGNGYSSPGNHAILYAVDPQTGALLTKIDLCASVADACSAGAPEGLSTVAIGQAHGLQGQPITQVYAGDLQGNLWAVDVSDTTPSNWHPRLLFKARDVGGNPQPITTAPVVTLNPNYPRQQGLFVMFGTGQLLAPNDLLSHQTQTVYGIWDQPGAAQVFTRTNLQQQTLTLVSAATSGLPQDILTDTNATVNFGTQVGWYADLPVGGQRVTTDPQLLNGTFLTTLNQPPASGCGAAPTAMLLELTYANGGAFALPQLDVNGNLAIDANDLYLGRVPVGIGAGSMRSSGYASAPAIRGPNTAGQMVKSITLSTGQQATIINPNNNPRTASWWQIQ